MSEELLKLICTGRHTHPSRALANLGWIPQMREDGTVVAESMNDPSSYTVQSLGGTVRWTNTGRERTTKVQPVETLTRADGGRTFIMPACATCGRSIRLRDDTVRKLMRNLDTPRRAGIDVSLLPM